MDRIKSGDKFLCCLSNEMRALDLNFLLDFIGIVKIAVEDHEHPRERGKGRFLLAAQGAAELHPSIAPDIMGEIR